jgi:predicted nucleic acid-binding protein
MAVKYLLDVNLLISGILEDHADHQKAAAWLDGKNLVLCPLAELGFIRITTGGNIGSTMEKARKSLEEFIAQRGVQWIPDDLSARESHPKNSNQVTDHYLADLAAKHGLKLATLDRRIPHPSVEVVL